MKLRSTLTCLLMLLASTGMKCPGNDPGSKMYLKSPSFDHKGMIPAKFTCDGPNYSPALEWGNLPENTASLALICDDPDAPSKVWVHWVIYNIPPEKEKLKERLNPQKRFENGMLQGINSFGNTGYGGPCPPSGTHRYFFKLYALDIQLDNKPGLTKSELLNKVKGHILEQTGLMGKYRR